MAKKKTENPDGLTEEEQAAEIEMQEDAVEVVAEEEAVGEETLSDDEPEKPAEEPKAEEPEPEKPEPTTVPLAALDSERHKRKDAEGRLAVLEDKMAALTAPQAPSPPEEAPDPVLDFEGWKTWYARQREADAQPVREITAQIQQQREFEGLKQFAQSSEVAFSAQNADYNEAREYARGMKAEEFRSYGYADEQISALVNHAEAQVAALARERGVSPAQIVYNYAKMTGFKAKVPAEGEGEKIARLAETQKKTQSTSGAGGSAREEEWTAERISNLDDAGMASLDDAIFKRVMGG